jgi:hypothetical protein
MPPRVVRLQQPAPSFPAADGVSRCRHRRWHYGGHEDEVVLALVGALLVNMRHICGERIPEGSLAKADELREGPLFHRAHPMLRIGVQIGRARWEWYTRNAGIINDPLKGWTEFCITVVNEVLTWLKEGPQSAMVTLQATCIIHA